MDAVEVVSQKDVDEDGYVTQVVVWAVPEPVPGSTHHIKYRLYFGRHGERLIGYDNERGKGDHRHVGRREFPYDFVDVPTLLEDFRKEVTQWLRAHREP